MTAARSYETLRREARPYAEALFAAAPCRDNYAAGDAEHEIQLNQDAFASTAIARGETIAEVAERHGLRDLDTCELRRVG